MAAVAKAARGSASPMNGLVSSGYCRRIPITSYAACCRSPARPSDYDFEWIRSLKTPAEIHAEASADCSTCISRRLPVFTRVTPSGISIAA